MFYWDLHCCRNIVKDSEIGRIENRMLTKLIMKQKAFHFWTTSFHLVCFLKSAQNSPWLFATSETMKICCTPKVELIQGSQDTWSPKIKTAVLGCLFIYSLEKDISLEMFHWKRNMRLVPDNPMWNENCAPSLAIGQKITSSVLVPWALMEIRTWWSQSWTSPRNSVFAFLRHHRKKNTSEFEV